MGWSLSWQRRRGSAQNLKCRFRHNFLQGVKWIAASTTLCEPCRALSLKCRTRALLCVCVAPSAFYAFSSSRRSKTSQPLKMHKWDAASWLSRILWQVFAAHCQPFSRFSFAGQFSLEIVVSNQAKQTNKPPQPRTSPGNHKTIIEDFTIQRSMN